MYPIFITSIMLLLSMFLQSSIDRNIDLTKTMEAMNNVELKTEILHNIVNKYRNENYIYPDQNTLENDPINFNLKYAENDLHYFLANNVRDGTWTFDRFMLFNFFEDPMIYGSEMVPLDVVTMNPLGLGNFYTAPEWTCDHEDVDAHIFETKTVNFDKIIKYKKELDVISKKITTYYSTVGEFPKIDHTGSALSFDIDYSLADIVGYTGNAEDCNQNFVFESIPLTCKDIFLIENNNVYYRYNDSISSRSYAYLSTDTDITNDSNNVIKIVSKIETRF